MTYLADPHGRSTLHLVLTALIGVTMAVRLWIQPNDSGRSIQCIALVPSLVRPTSCRHWVVNQVRARTAAADVPVDI